MDLTNTPSNYHLAYSSCNGGQGYFADKVKLTIQHDDSYFTLCKIGLFGDANYYSSGGGGSNGSETLEPGGGTCTLSTQPALYYRTAPYIEFGMKAGTKKGVSFPTISSLPTGCSVTWAVYLTST